MDSADPPGPQKAQNAQIRFPKSGAAAPAAASRSTRGPRSRGCSARACRASTGRCKARAARSIRTTSCGPGMLYGRILRSPHAHARLKSIDASAAEKAPGVKALLITIKPGDKVMYPGEEIGALAATTEQQAADALRMIKVEWEVLPALATVEQSMRPEAPQVFTPANTRRGTAQEDGDLAAGFKAAAFTVEGDLLDAGADAHVARNARLRLRVERRQPDGVGVDAGGARHARRICAGPEDSAGQRARDHRVHGRRLRQQVRPRHAGPAVRATREGRQRAGEADARSQGRAPRDRQSAVGIREGEGRRLRGRQAHRVRRDRRGAPAARARDPITRCRTSTSSRIASACTPTSTSTPDSSARCARPDIRRAASSPKC